MSTKISTKRIKIANDNINIPNLPNMDEKITITVNGEKYSEIIHTFDQNYQDGKYKKKCFMKETFLGNLKHSVDDHPAEIGYFPDGIIRWEIWYKDGLVHRDNELPAHIFYFNNGKMSDTYWYVDGVMVKAEIYHTSY